MTASIYFKYFILGWTFGGKIETSAQRLSLFLQSWTSSLGNPDSLLFISFVLCLLNHIQLGYKFNNQLEYTEITMTIQVERCIDLNE